MAALNGILTFSNVHMGPVVVVLRPRSELAGLAPGLKSRTRLSSAGEIDELLGVRVWSSTPLTAPTDFS